MISRQRREVTSRAVHVVVIVRVMSRVVVGGIEILTLNLSSGLGQDRNVSAAVVVVNGRVRESKGSVRVGRRDIGRSQCGGGSRADRLGSRRRRHHRLGVHVRRENLMLLVLVLVLLMVLGLVLLALVSSSRVGVVVNPRVSSQLIRAGELLAAARKLAGMRLLSRVSADVSSLVLQAVEGLLAERALVGSRELIGSLRGLGAGQRPVGLDDGDCCGSHVAVNLMVFFEVLLSGCCGI